MSGSSNIGKWALAAAVVVVVGVAAFFGGRDMAASGYKAERELDIKINRSKLDGLGEIQGPIYVAGHKSPDMDTVGSAIGYAALLRKLGYDATPVVLGDINNETRYVLECAGVEVPELLEDASGALTKSGGRATFRAEVPEGYLSRLGSSFTDGLRDFADWVGDVLVSLAYGWLWIVVLAAVLYGLFRFLHLVSISL